MQRKSVYDFLVFTKSVNLGSTLRCKDGKWTRVCRDYSILCGVGCYTWSSTGSTCPSGHHWSSDHHSSFHSYLYRRWLPGCKGLGHLVYVYCPAWAVGRTDKCLCQRPSIRVGHNLRYFMFLLLIQSICHPPRCPTSICTSWV